MVSAEKISWGLVFIFPKNSPTTVVNRPFKAYCLYFICHTHKRLTAIFRTFAKGISLKQPTDFTSRMLFLTLNPHSHSDKVLEDTYTLGVVFFYNMVSAPHVKPTVSQY